ncbi:5'-nucleotidase [Pedobacter sp. UBA5917]|jgi:5'-nucleotidase|uniref:5'-nucleotidase n=1 Tax=Pedobacter sp. UBA5917 TaxID=1947061 RepID=UPI0025CE9ECC|nr:5'-nucleotidase [Pedobacter sp. UBA5917]
MPSFEKVLVVAISTRALFDLEEENRIYHEQGADAYRAYQREHEEDILKKGTAFYLVEALLGLNKLSEERLVEVIIMSKNSPETGIRVLNSIDHYNLDITRSAFTGSEPLSIYMKPFTVDLFLSRDEEDVQKTIDSRVAAAALIYDPPKDYVADNDSVRIAFDADAVLFSEESEYIYKTQGMAAFHDNEKTKVQEPLKDGPYAKVLRMLSEIQRKIQEKHKASPLRIAILTARNSPSHKRVLNTLRYWNVQVDEAFFLGGIKKDEILKAFKAHIFFDDQEAHLEKAALVVPSGKVPYSTNSALRNLDVETLSILKHTFRIPEQNNVITTSDISKGILRITAGIDFMLPNEAEQITLVFDNKDYICKYTKRIGRSDLLNVGKRFVIHSNLSTGDVLAFTVLSPGKYSVDKI